MRKLFLLIILFVLELVVLVNAQSPLILTLDAVLSGVKSGISQNVTVKLHSKGSLIITYKETVSTIFNNGAMNLTLGTNSSNPLSPEYLDIPNPEFLVEVEGITGQVALSIFSAPFSLR